jgi:sigma-B regulation protein RsbU (phosphoserine phosphatase)
MKSEDPFLESIKRVDANNPQLAPLIKQLLEYRAAAKDDELKNRLLLDLVLKYASAEKKLAALNKELVEKQRLLEEDLAAAAQIQRSLLPQKISAAKRLEVSWNFEPCAHVGGDIFNVIPLDDDHWVIYMLDVSGHGMSAAMVTVSVNQTLQSQTGYISKQTTEPSSGNELKTPVEILQALHEEYPFERFDNFITMTYLTLDTKNGSLRYSNAGHPPPVLMRKNGKIELLTKGGPVIGLSGFTLLNEQEVTFEGDELQLFAGDKLFVYTDGIIEYQNENGELYGSDRFLNTLRSLNEKSILEIIEMSVKSLMDFGNNMKPDDDISLVGLELK